MPRRMHGPQGCALSGDDIPIAKEPARGGGGGGLDLCKASMKFVEGPIMLV